MTRTPNHRQLGKLPVKCVSMALCSSMLIGTVSKADTLSPGKYACIVENAGGMFDRKNKISVGKLSLDEGKFILTIQINSEDIRQEACEKALDASKGKAKPIDFELRADGLLCTSKYSLEIKSEEILNTSLYGNDDFLYSYTFPSFMSIIDRDSRGFKYLMSEVVEGDNGKIEQYVYRGSCDKF